MGPKRSCFKLSQDLFLAYSLRFESGSVATQTVISVPHSKNLSASAAQPFHVGDWLVEPRLRRLTRGQGTVQLEVGPFPGRAEVPEW